MKMVYLNGKFLPLEEACIPVTDRGFLFGDSVYEVVPVYFQKPFRLSEHLNRLQRSLDEIRLPLALDHQQWQTILKQLIQYNDALYPDKQSFYIQISRGSAAERNHSFPDNLHPTVFVQSMPFKSLSAKELEEGLTAITLMDSRWEKCHIKTTALLANVLLYQEAKEKHAHEAILVRNGLVFEASSSNVFIVKNGVLQTPPLSNFLLAGITRQFILELAKKNQIPAQETPITVNQLFAADEVWITSSTREIYPIVKIDERIIGTGKPGTIFQKMLNWYHLYLQDEFQHEKL